MPKQRIYVNVVGFSDVERHALNTVFRLSEDRELSYAPWVPLAAPGVSTTSMNAEVSLVDGDSAEAVLIHARELPAGQRLIWVGPDAPLHAWRVLQRPIRWSGVLDDLDATYAARLADSGFLDLDITSPSPLEETRAAGLEKRALLVGLGPKDLLVLRECLVRVGISEVEVAQTTEQALVGIGGRRFACGLFNLDDHHIDVWSLAGMFAQHNPSALTMGISEHAGPLSSWWNRRRIKRDTARTGINAVVSRPVQARDLQPWLALLL
jgi:hypothetical protein